MPSGRDELEEHWARLKARDKASNRRTNRKRRMRRILVELTLVALLVAIAFVPSVRSQWQPYLDDLIKNFKTTAPAPALTSAPAPSPVPVPKPQELVLYMLDLINKDRMDSGLAPVTLGNNTAAQKHAEERLANDYTSHWGMDGMKPYMRYTLAGGFNYEAENGFVTRTVWISGKDPFYKRDPIEMLSEAEKSLMNSPGHRRNILNKWHKKVNIGIAYNKESLHLVQQFEGDYIEFSKLPALSGNILTMAGRVSLGTVDSVALYYDPLPQPLIPRQLEAPPYDYSYSVGATLPPGIALLKWDLRVNIFPPPPPGFFYNLDMDQIQATRWDVSPNGSFAIEADISSFLRQRNGVYTIVFWAQVRSESINLTNFSIFVGPGR